MQIERLESRRLLASQGVLDTTFGVGGRVQFEQADNESVHARTIGPDGSVFVALGANDAFRVIKFDASGKIDDSFGGGDGVLELPASIGTVKQVRALRHGKLMITGTSTADSSPTTGPDMIAMRFGVHGVLDKSFGKDGIARVDLVSAEVGKPVNDALHVSDISADGAVVLVSRMFYHNDTVGSEMGIALLRPDGQLESRFFGDGTYLSSAHRHIDPYPDSIAGVEWSAVSFTNDGNAFDLFENTNLHSTDSGGNEHMLIGDSQVHRFALRGSTWRGNVTDGHDLLIGAFAREDFFPTVNVVARQPDDGLLVLVENASSNSDARLVHITPSLKLDSKFGEANGEIRTIANDVVAIATLPDGRFYTTTDTAIARFLTDGKPDPLFAPIAQLDGDKGVALASSDAAIVVGNGFVRRHTGGPNIHLDSRGTLELAGSSGEDKVEVFTREDGRVGVRLNSLRASFAPSAVKRVSIHGYGSDDLLRVSIKKTARLWGGDGNDGLAGGPWHDILTGDAGNDNLFGAAGNDALYGHDGRDILNGGAGNDRVFGNAGFDAIDGGDDDDTGRQGDGASVDVEVFV